MNIGCESLEISCAPKNAIPAVVATQLTHTDTDRTIFKGLGLADSWSDYFKIYPVHMCIYIYVIYIYIYVIYIYM